MKNRKSVLMFWVLCTIPFNIVIAQDNIYPAPKQTGTIIINNGTVFTGTGKTIERGSVVIRNGKIVSVGAGTADEAGATIVDASGKNVYPGLILASSDLGLKEIESGVRGSNDYRELGDYNVPVRSIVAYNTDSKIMNTLRNSGILLANVVPEGSLVTGTSSVVQLDAWTWEDAVYKADNGLHLFMPSLMQAARSPFGSQTPAGDPVKDGIKIFEAVQSYFKEGQAYFKQSKRPDTNLKFEALRPLFEKKQKLFVHANTVRQILVAVNLAKQFEIEMVLVGGSDSYLVADLLKQNNIPVILKALQAFRDMIYNSIKSSKKNNR